MWTADSSASNHINHIVLLVPRLFALGLTSFHEDDDGLVAADVQDGNDVSEPTTAGNDTFVVDGTDCPTYAVPVIEELSTSIHKLSVADDNHSETQSTSSSSPLPPRSQTDSHVRVIQTQKGQEGGKGGEGRAGREGTPLPNILLHPQSQFSRNMSDYI